MMLEGFDIRAGYILAFGRWELDLHNDYDVAEVMHRPDDGSARITLRRTTGDWVNMSQPKSLVLRFDQVSRFDVEDGNPALADDRETICYIGFQSPEDEAVDAYVENLTDPSQHLIMGMEDESAIKIYSQGVTLSVNA